MSTTPLPPVSPDFCQCSNQWNGVALPHEVSQLGSYNFALTQRPSLSSCLSAANRMAAGRRLKTYVVDGNGDYSLPWQFQSGNCRVLLELVGPSAQHVQRVSLVPAELRGMAFWVIQECVQNDQGGFVTKDFKNITEYLLNPATDLDSTVYPPSARFVTVTIDGGDAHPPLGDYAPTFISRIAALFTQKLINTNQNIEHWQDAVVRYFVGGTALRATGKPWWPTSTTSPSYDRPATNDTSYECDVSLGKPSASDCSQLDYTQLGAPSDSFTVGTSSPKVFSLNDCSVAITSDHSTVVTWNAVRIALGMVIAVCITNPIASIGGRAFAESGPAINTGIIGRSIDPLNILPPHVNLTLYQPGHFYP